MPASVDAATVGPNAVIQLIAALRSAGQDRLCAQVFDTAAATHWLETPPETMVPQAPVARLHQQLRAAGPPGEMAALLADAGHLTADYLLANRIPRPVQVLMKPLPLPLRARFLVSAIRRHAWTFAGAGRFTAHNGAPTVFELTGNPFCADEHADAPVCAWHEAVFQRLFQVLVSPRTVVEETACEARNDPCCRFVVDWTSGV
jgi:divinyl protochlorophyllide a 8-vinyl-reductase